MQWIKALLHKSTQYLCSNNARWFWFQSHFRGLKTQSKQSSELYTNLLILLEFIFKWRLLIKFCWFGVKGVIKKKTYTFLINGSFWIFFHEQKANLLIYLKTRENLLSRQILVISIKSGLSPWKTQWIKALFP